MTQAHLDVSTPAVILRSVAYGGLGIARTLGRLGVPVYTVESNAAASVLRSRYNRGRFCWDEEKESAAASVSFLCEVSEKVGGRPVLIPTTDHSAIFVADHAAELSAYFRLPHPDKTLVRSLLDKSALAELCSQHGVATPRTQTLRSPEDAIEIARDLGYPVLLKATDGTRIFELCGKKIFLARSEKELLSICKLADSETFSFVLQEWVPEAQVWMFDGYFDATSKCTLSFTGRKLRALPVDFGYTSLGVCQGNAVVTKLCRDFMRALGYQGVVDIDLLYDQRDRSYKIIDVNPRVGATFRLFVGENGADVVRALYCDMTGQQWEPSRAADGRKWIVEDRDLLSAAHGWKNRELSVAAWMKSLAGLRETAYFAADDPLPAFHRMSHLTSRFLKKTDASTGALPVAAQSGNRSLPAKAA